MTLRLQIEIVGRARLLFVWMYLAANGGTVRRIAKYVPYMLSALLSAPRLPRPDVMAPQFFSISDLAEPISAINSRWHPAWSECVSTVNAQWGASIARQNPPKQGMQLRNRFSELLHHDN